MNEPRAFRIAKMRKPGGAWQRHGNKFTAEEAAAEQERLKKKGWAGVIIYAIKEEVNR